MSITTPLDLDPPPPPRTSFSASLRALADDTTRERIAISDLLNALGDRAVAALMFVFAVPNVLPVPPGTSAVLGAPLVFLAAQLAFGRPPWLPRFIAGRSIARRDFASVVDRISPWLGRAERLMRPRLTWLAQPPMEYAVGTVCLLLAIVLALPIPLGNVLPAVAISILTLGIMERDGLWIIAGLCASVVASVVVSGVVYAMAKAALFLIANAFS